MIKKFRPIPNEILKLEALLRRLIMNYPDRNNLEKELAKSYAGFRGEQALDYHIAQIPGNEHYIFKTSAYPIRKIASSKLIFSFYRGNCSLFSKLKI